jgi:PPOX class probable F420-dependent enzyme
MFDDRPAVSRRLADEAIAWLTTVSPDGMPQTSPVWFLVEGDSILVYSRGDTARVRNLEGNPLVSLNLDGNGRGGGIVVIEGEAQIDEAAPPAYENPSYLAKYGPMIEGAGWTAVGFAADYPVPMRIRARRLRAW